jgi:hypothetical protein
MGRHQLNHSQMIASPGRRRIFLPTLFVVSALTLYVVYQIAKPLDQQILTARHLDYIGKDVLWDGGSRSFTFRLPYWRFPGDLCATP